MPSSDGLRDEAVLSDVRDTMAHDARFADLCLNIEVIGGVVHLAGELGSAVQIDALRRTIARTRGVHAVWDVLRLPGQADSLLLDIGCGSKKQWPGAIGVDIWPAGSVDVLASLQSDLPFRDESVDAVFAVHVLEHLHDLVRAMGEIHRVLKANGLLHIMVPDRRAAVAYADPTHVRFFNLEAIRFFCTEHHAVPLFSPLTASTDGVSIFADLLPVRDGPPPSELQLARVFGA